MICVVKKAVLCILVLAATVSCRIHKLHLSVSYMIDFITVGKLNLQGNDFVKTIWQLNKVIVVVSRFLI